jgi:hypothetical protein
MAMQQPHQRPATAYGELLRPIGAFLDGAKARDVVLAEIHGGFTWTFTVRGSSGSARSLTVGYQDLPRLGEQVRGGRKSSTTMTVESEDLVTLPSNVLPMHALGYQEKFRSLGAKLDGQHAEQIQIVEVNQVLLVRFVLPAPRFLRQAEHPDSDMVRFREDTYDTHELAALISGARSRRGSRYYY